MIGAVAELGYLPGVGIADEAPVKATIGLLVEESVEPRAPQARRVEAEEGSEFGDEVGEDGVEEEKSDEDPFQDCVDENYYDSVGVSV